MALGQNNVNSGFLCGIQGAPTKVDTSTRSSQPLCHPESPWTECPVLPTAFKTHLLQESSVSHEALSSFLQPRLRTSCCSSLFSGSPAAPLKGNSLPFSASPQIRPPRQLWYGSDHRHLAHSCCGCNWTVSPQGSDTLVLYLLSKWCCCLGVHSTQMVSILVFWKFLQTSFPFAFCLAHCSFGPS